MTNTLVRRLNGLDAAIQRSAQQREVLEGRNAILHRLQDVLWALEFDVGELMLALGKGVAPRGSLADSALAERTLFVLASPTDQARSLEAHLRLARKHAGAVGVPDSLRTEGDELERRLRELVARNSAIDDSLERVMTANQVGTKFARSLSYTDTLSETQAARLLSAVRSARGAKERLHSDFTRIAAGVDAWDTRVNAYAAARRERLSRNVRRGERASLLLYLAGSALALFASAMQARQQKREA